MYKDKLDIINHYEASIDWVKRLRELPEERWRTQVDQDKWTIAEIIGHFIPWDEFVIRQRIPYLFKDAQLPASPDAELVNQQAAEESRNRSKDETIDLFIVNRESLVRSLYDLPDELWTQDLFKRKKKISLIDYFSGLVAHDYHHFRQIQRVL
ncbi:DinB family protein [Bacillus testis]|uniref:DinB family protein n=1 Tax=Bacillus testis TaxID=1622072 RepID=UPI00067F17D2|nr:DinB family protein [Bacillus testis]